MKRRLQRTLLEVEIVHENWLRSDVNYVLKRCYCSLETTVLAKSSTGRIHRKGEWWKLCCSVHFFILQFLLCFKKNEEIEEKNCIGGWWKQSIKVSLWKCGVKKKCERSWFEEAENKLWKKKRKRFLGKAWKIKWVLLKENLKKRTSFEKSFWRKELRR